MAMVGMPVISVYGTLFAFNGLILGVGLKNLNAFCRIGQSGMALLERVTLASLKTLINSVLYHLPFQHCQEARS